MARIVVVEDNPQNLRLTSVILQSQGYEVVLTGDAEEADRAIGERMPDLILMDLGLPGKDGYTFTRELRARMETSRLPILAVSSFAMRGDEKKALEAGCTGYLAKPIRRGILLERVKELLAPDGPGAGAVPSQSKE
jgi:CheY-like chemotaxis protein